jgi:Domain of unknown function (DUF4126)
MEVLSGAAAGIGLAAACGFRVFVPLLALGLAGRCGLLPLAHGFEWLASPAALAAFSVATLLEAAAYKIPWLDHALDTLTTPAALFAGVLSVAAVTAGLPPAVRVSLALIAGGGTAALVQGATVLARLKSTALTGGLANPLFALMELGASAFTSLLAVLAPLLAMTLVLLLLAVLAVRVGRRGIPGRRTR